MSHPLHTIPSDGDMLCRQVIDLENKVTGFGESVYRVEGKVDKIVSTLDSLIRIEERQVAINARLSDGSETMQNLDGRLKAIEVEMPGIKGATSKVDKVIWFVFMAVVMALVGLVVVSK